MNNEELVRIVNEHCPPRCPKCRYPSVGRCTNCGFAPIQGPQVFSSSAAWSASRRAVRRAIGPWRRWLLFLLHQQSSTGFRLGSLRVSLWWSSKKFERPANPWALTARGFQRTGQPPAITLKSVREHYAPGSSRYHVDPRTAVIGKPPLTTLTFRLKMRRFFRG